MMKVKALINTSDLKRKVGQSIDQAKSKTLKMVENKTKSQPGILEFFKKK
jgi:hypothetical protein